MFRAVAGRDGKAPFGLKRAKRCQSAGSFTPKIGRSPMLCKTLKKGSLRLRIRMPRKTTYPSYLYRRGQLFSFRYVIPERYRKQGKTELRLSPPNAIPQWAKKLAQRLLRAPTQMVGMLWITKRSDCGSTAYSGLCQNKICKIFRTPFPDHLGHCYSPLW